MAVGGCDGPAAPPARAEPDIRETILGGPDGRAAWACFRCHGQAGGGDGGGSPRLAGLPAGYLEKQLLDYAEETRPDKVMSPIARMLEEPQRRDLARWYASLPPVSVPGESGPWAQGERLYRRGDPDRGLRPCAECHGQHGEGIGPAFPPLAGQPAAYLSTQLDRWRRGVRRNDPRGVMVRQARLLTPAEAEALARYLAALPPAAPATGSSAP